MNKCFSVKLNIIYPRAELLRMCTSVFSSKKKKKKECSLYAVKISQRPSTSCQIKGLFGMSINLIAKSLFIYPCYTEIPKRKLVKSAILLRTVSL